MRLEDLLDIINTTLEFELYDDERVGVFCIEDSGIREYKNREVYCIDIKDNKLIIKLN